MSKLSPIKTKKLIHMLIAEGWCEKKRQGIGSSHKCFEKEGCVRPIVINNDYETPVFQIMQIIKHLNMTRDQFLNKIRKS